MIATNQDGRDPTQTLTLRRAYESALRRRWRRVVDLLRQTIVDNDALGLTRPSMAIFQEPVGQPANDLGLNETDAAKLTAFLLWFQSVINAEVLGIRGIDNGVIDHTNWQTEFITDAYTRGLKQANIDLRKAGIDTFDLPSAFTNPESLLLIQPIHRDALTLQEERLFNDLQGITAAVIAQSQRLLAEGLNQGQTPEELFQAILDRIEKIGITRSNSLADTAVIALFADALLNRFFEMGVEEVVVEPDVIFTVTTNPDGSVEENVCELCEGLFGERFTIDAARGVIPVHVGCRCSWTPAPEFVANASDNGFPLITVSELGYLESKLNHIKALIPTLDTIEDGLFDKGWNKQGLAGKPGKVEVIESISPAAMAIVNMFQRKIKDLSNQVSKANALQVRVEKHQQERLVIGWARNINGAGFQLTPRIGLNWIAIIVTTKTDRQLKQSDFTGRWANLGRLVRSSGGSGDLQTTYNNSNPPRTILDVDRGGIQLRDGDPVLNAPFFQIQDNAGTTTYFQVSANETLVGNIKFIESEAALPAIVGGKIKLEAGILYVPSRAFTLTADTLVFPSGSTGWSHTNAVPHPVTHTGAGPLFQVESGATALINNATFIGDGTQTVFDVDDASGFFVQHSGMANFASMGIVKNGAQAITLANQYTNVGTGITFENISDLVAINNAEIKNATTSNSANWSFVGTFDRITVSLVTGNPQTGESVFDFDSGITVNSAGVFDTAFSNANGGTFFAAGSLDESDVRFNYDGGIRAPESQIIGEMTGFNNTDMTIISTANTYVPINFTLSGTTTQQQFVLNAGATGAITAFATGGGGVTVVTSAAHGLANGDSVDISGTTSYNGLFVVSSVLTNTYEIQIAFVADDATGTWYRPPNLECTSLSPGIFVKIDATTNILSTSSPDPDIEGDTLTTAVFMDSGAGYVIIASTEEPLIMGTVLGSPQQKFISNGFSKITTGDKLAVFGKNNSTTENFTAPVVKMTINKS